MRIGYGFWRHAKGDQACAREMVATARDLGVDHFDTADVYGAPDAFGGAEELIGALLARDPGLFDGAEIATKVGVTLGVPYDSSPHRLRLALEGSLRRLRTDCVDLLYIHRPDMLAHPAEVARFLDEAVDGGRTRKIGVSNFTTHQVTALVAHLKAPVAAHQLEFSALNVDVCADGRLDQAMGLGFSAYAWSPLAGGRLMDGEGRAAQAVRAALRPIAEREGVELAAAALAFVLVHPSGAIPIVGTRSPDRLRELVAAERVLMSRAEWYAVYQAATGERLP